MEELDKEYKNINKFYVENGKANINGETVELDSKISMLPCLIDGLNYFMTIEPILEHLRSPECKNQLISKAR